MRTARTLVRLASSPACPTPTPVPAARKPVPSAEALALYRVLGADNHKLLKCCEREHYQGSGKGGQHRNRVKTAVRLTCPKYGVTAESSYFRSGHANLMAAAKDLKLRLAVEVRSHIALADPPQPAPEHAHDAAAAKEKGEQSEGSDGEEEGREKGDELAGLFVFPGSQGRVNEANPLYPRFIAVMLDLLHSHGGQLKPVGEVFGLTTSALGRIAFANKLVLAAVQRTREQCALPLLRNRSS